MTQASLRSFRLSAPAWRLCPWQVARALGLREASIGLHGGAPNLPWIAARVAKVGGGNPATSPLHELFQKVDGDPSWFPGKHNGAKRGRKPRLTPAKRRCIAESAMVAKRKHGQEPCVTAAVRACPAATWNPETYKPFLRQDYPGRVHQRLLLLRRGPPMEVPDSFAENILA